MKTSSCKLADSNINLGELDDEEVLFFIRIKGKKHYFDLFYPSSFLSRFNNLKSFRTISEYEKDADVIIDFEKYSLEYFSFSDFALIEEVINIQDVINRCRGLRSIPLEEARTLIFLCSKYFIDFFTLNPKIKLIVSGTVDNYVMDLMFKFANHYSVVCLGITDFFLYPKYKLVTNYGEANKVYSPTQEEIDSVLTFLINKGQSQLAIARSKLYLNLPKYFISFYFRYFVRYIYSYKLRGRLAYEYRFAPFLKGFNSIGQLLFSSKYFDIFDEEAIKSKKNNLVYIPLHWYPEATTDYWNDKSDKAYYYEQLYKVIVFFQDKGVTVLLKEHPAFYISREINIYRQLKKFRNVILIDPFVRTQQIFDCIENVVVWNGSTGVEALIAGKNVYCTMESYYSIGLIPLYTDFGNPYLFSAKEKKDIINVILQSSLKV